MINEQGQSESCEIIAEVGVNHNGDVETAKELIRRGASAGADVIKFQTFTPEKVVSKGANKATYQERSSSPDQYEMLSGLTLTERQHQHLFDYCKEIGIEFASTPYSPRSVKTLESLDVKRYKVASADIVNKPLLKAVAETGKPIILSTGMATLGEIERAVNLLSKAGCENLTVLHCVSDYPTSPEQVNMRFMDTLEAAFETRVGFSDHTTGIHIPAMAVSRGATVIEKHLTLDREMEGPDHFASLEPEQFGEMVSAIRDVEEALGTNRRMVSEDERDNRTELRRSLHARRDLSAGETITEDDLKVVRPATGISPWEISEVQGRTLQRDLAAETALTWRDVAE
jgi:N-acetylneuraminate synthase